MVARWDWGRYMIHCVCVCVRAVVAAAGIPLFSFALSPAGADGSHWAIFPLLPDGLLL